MRHKWEKIDPPNGAPYWEETCSVCGRKRGRYKNGSTCYFNEKGKKTPYPQPCLVTHDSDQLIRPDEIPETQINAVTEVLPKVVRSSTPIKPVEKERLLEDARLSECLVIIRLVYEDLVTNNIMSKARQIAGRFLYSSGYESWIKELDSKRN